MHEVKIAGKMNGRESIHNDIERFFNHFAQWKRPQAFFEKAWKPYCDIYESSGCLHVIVEISGVSESEVEVMLQGRTLIIRGDRPQAQPPEYQTVHQMEINFGRFERVLDLPHPVDEEATTATYRNGFLFITLPKIAANTGRGIHIVQQ
jgi:HSP20 family protein